MAEAPNKDDQPAATADATAGAGAPQRMGVRLAPVNNSDQQVVENRAAVNVAPGMVFLEFGFIEPNLLAALPRAAKQGGKLPQTVNGKLAVRAAMGYDRFVGLHQQNGGVLTALRAASTSAKEKH